jgi:hypothetical protein
MMLLVFFQRHRCSDVAAIFEMVTPPLVHHDLIVACFVVGVQELSNASITAKSSVASD